LFYAFPDFRQEYDVNQDDFAKQGRELGKRNIEQKACAEYHNLVSAPAFCRSGKHERFRLFKMRLPRLTVAPGASPHGDGFVQIVHVPYILRAGSRQGGE
jgi:hypothetical protein